MLPASWGNPCKSWNHSVKGGKFFPFLMSVCKNWDSATLREGEGFVYFGKVIFMIFCLLYQVAGFIPGCSAKDPSLRLPSMETSSVLSSAQDLFLPFKRRDFQVKSDSSEYHPVPPNKEKSTGCNSCRVVLTELYRCCSFLPAVLTLLINVWKENHNSLSVSRQQKCPKQTRMFSPTMFALNWMTQTGTTWQGTSQANLKDIRNISKAEMQNFPSEQELQKKENLLCVRTYSWAGKGEGMTQTATNMTLEIFYMFYQIASKHFQLIDHLPLLLSTQSNPL